MESEEFKIDPSSSKALLKPSEALLISYYQNLVEDNFVNENYPLTGGTGYASRDLNRVISYEYPAWSAYSDLEVSSHHQEKDGGCCNSCAMILSSIETVFPCDGCSQMTYCSEKCKTNHASDGHDFTFCNIMRRMEQNCITKGELLSLVEEVPKEEDYGSPIFTKNTICTSIEINRMTRNAMKKEKRFVRSGSIDFGKLIHEIVRVECATCGGNKYDSDETGGDREERSSSGSDSLPDLNDEDVDWKNEDIEFKCDDRKEKKDSRVGDLIVECNSFSKSPAIFPKFEKLPPLDKKAIVIANSYLNSLDYDDEVDTELFDCQKISKALFDLYESSVSNDEETFSSDQQCHDVGAFFNLGMGPYPYRRRRRHYPGPVYYGRPYGWRYGRRYIPRIGYYGYYGGPRLNYYVGTYGGQCDGGIGGMIATL